MRKYTADLVLIENSTAGNPDRVFPAQTVHFRREADTVHTSADGFTTTASYDTLVRWTGGKASDLDQVTDVKLVQADGLVLVSGSLNLNFNPPADQPGGMVEFAVFEGQ